MSFSFPRPARNLRVWHMCRRLPVRAPVCSFPNCRRLLSPAAHDKWPGGGASFPSQTVTVNLVINFTTLSLNIYRRTVMDWIVRVENDTMSPSVVQNFLRRVSRRQKIVSLARQWRFFLLIASGFYALALLASRLLGLLPAWFTPVTLAVFPAGALVLAWIFYQRTDVTHAARSADARMGTHDLFLPASLIEHSLGAYQDLVMQEAEQRAAKMAPQKVVPYDWQRGTFRICAALAVLALAAYCLD